MHNFTHKHCQCYTPHTSTHTHTPASPSTHHTYQYALHTHTHTQTGNREEAMAAFRTYLENRGSQLSQNTELASLFALPYVPNPSNHPSFKKLFLVSYFTHNVTHAHYRIAGNFCCGENFRMNCPIPYFSIVTKNLMHVD